MRTIIRCGTLIDGVSDEVYEDVGVVVEDGRFAEVAPFAEVDQHGEHELVDAAGLTVLPGLIDGHVHLNHGPYRPIISLAASLRMGITTLATVQGMSATDVVATREAIDEGILENCARLIAGEVCAPTNGHVKGRVADGPWEVRKAVRELIMAGCDFIKTAASGGFYREDEEMWWEDYTLEELRALTEEAHSVGRRVAVHAHTQPGLNHSIDCGIDIIYHGAMIDKEALEGIAEKGLFFIPTLRVTSDTNIAWKNECGRPWEARKMQEAHDIHRDGVHMARDMGIKIGMGTDFGIPLEGAFPEGYPWKFGDSAVELVELVGAGLTPLEAIRAATSVTAEAFGKDSQIGSIQPGRKADLFIIDGDPSADIRILTDEDRIRMVMKDGEVKVARPPLTPMEGQRINLGKR
jgi:imidazolonepropionase-like amidohydrolase